MTVEILPGAQRDLISGFRFYEQQAPGLGRYFIDCLFADIDALAFTVASTQWSLDIIGA